jgi:diacylglycerol diphosphate phosphatase/phosphatidate phosphatase
LKGVLLASFTAATFVVLYILNRWRVFVPGARHQIYKLTTALVPLLVAMFVALSRVMDYRHHWEDVLVGSLVGEI